MENVHKWKGGVQRDTRTPTLPHTLRCTHTDYQLCNVKSQVVSTETEYRSKTKNRKAFASISHWEWNREQWRSGAGGSTGAAVGGRPAMRHKPTTDPEQKRLLLRTEGGTTTFLLTKRRTVERRFSLNISALRAFIPRLLCMGRVRVVYVCVCGLPVSWACQKFVPKATKQFTQQQHEQVALQGRRLTKFCWPQYLFNFSATISLCDLPATPPLLPQILTGLS